MGTSQEGSKTLMQVCLHGEEKEGREVGWTYLALQYTLRVGVYHEGGGWGGWPLKRISRKILKPKLPVREAPPLLVIGRPALIPSHAQSLADSSL